MDVADATPWRLAVPVLVTRIGLAAMAVVAASCGGSPERPGAVASTTTSAIAPSGPVTTSTIPKGPDVRAAVEAGYGAAAQGYIEASKSPDPDHPAVTRTHTGPMLEQRRKVLGGLRRDGRAARQPPNSLYRIEYEGFESVDSATAQLTVCVVDDGVVFDVATGHVINDRVETNRARALMRLEDGVWKLAERELAEEWPGVGGCAVD